MKFSVLLPTRNRLELLRFAIETVRRQDYENWEIVVSDNNSDEDIRGFINSLADNRIVYLRSDTLIPVTENWNLALSRCTGDYIIMLGDDDGLLPGYFSSACELIDTYQHPEVLYTCSLLYAYPGVIVAAPEGFVKSYEKRSIFKGSKVPFILDQDDARAYVDASLDFRVKFDYNMQFFLVSRAMVHSLQAYGSFYQSPYPDYYAANALLHLSKNILVVPWPMVAIGISPKSFGYYYFNDQESKGTAFLENMQADPELAYLDRVVLPGTDMNTCWLMAMEVFAIRFGCKTNQSRYRELQIRFLLAKALRKSRWHDLFMPALHVKTTWRERIKFLWPVLLANFILTSRLRARLADKIMLRAQSHPSCHMPATLGRFTNMMQVYEYFTNQNI